MASSKAGLGSLISATKVSHQVLTCPDHLPAKLGYCVVGNHIDSSLQISSRPSLEVPATQFTRFPRLPIELRLLIWEYAMPDPRIIGSQWQDWPRETTLMMQFSPWSLINACQESRYEALKRYRVRLTNVWVPGVEDDAWPMLIDPSRDTVTLPINTSIKVADEELDGFAGIFADIQHLAIDAVRGHQHETLCLEWLTVLPAVRTLTVIVHDQSCSELRSSSVYCEVRTLTPIPQEETVLRGENLERYHRVLDEIVEKNPDWTRPKLSFVCLEVDGTRCCDLNLPVILHRHRPPPRNRKELRRGRRPRN